MRQVIWLVVWMSAATPVVAQENTQRGAILGGLSGALIGAAVGENNGEAAGGALIGSAIGLFSGAALGNSADQEQARWTANQRYRQHVVRSQAVSMADVIQMTHAGVGQSVIANQIQQRGVQRRPQVPDVIHLHQQGVSETVITLMQQAPVGGTVAPPAPAPAVSPVIVERHYVPTRPYWRPYHYGPPVYRRPYHHHPRSGVHVGFSFGR